MTRSDEGGATWAATGQVEPSGEERRTERRRLEGKVALVTGGGSGLGRAISLAFAREGASLVVAGRRSESLQETVREVRRLGGAGTFTRGDVSRPDRVEMIVQAATYNFGGLDILVNCAGDFVPGSITEIDERRWDRIIGTNLKGPFLVSRCAVAAMRERGGGSIVNVAATDALAPRRKVAAFAASKGGLVALTRSMAVDLASDGIRVNAICPGPLRSEAHAGGGRAGEEGGRIPAGRPEDVVGMAVFLASDESRWITGAVLPVDGGLLAGSDG